MIMYEDDQNTVPISCVLFFTEDMFKTLPLKYPIACNFIPFDVLVKN